MQNGTKLARNSKCNQVTCNFKNTVTIFKAILESLLHGNKSSLHCEFYELQTHKKFQSHYQTEAKVQYLKKKRVKNCP